MRQAIEEGFILDVLKNYTPCKLAFQLVHDGEEMTDRRTGHERSTAVSGIMQRVRLHPYNIAQKVQVVVEHFLRQSSRRCWTARAKAMVVVASRKEACAGSWPLTCTIKAQRLPHRHAGGLLRR